MKSKKILLKSISFLLLSFLAPNDSFSQDINIIPQPQSVSAGKGNFLLNKNTVILVRNGVDDNSADFFIGYAKLYYGLTLRKVKAAKSNFIELTTLQTLVPGKEGMYSLSGNPISIIIRGQTASGTFCGVQTLIQLLPLPSKSTAYKIPVVEIYDEPRFSYRGMHLDVGRHFFPASFVKKYIDWLALHKFNYFHWHLTEDQGWRIEIKKYPRLTQFGAWRNGTIIGRFPGRGNDKLKYGGFYTQAEIKDIVAYARKRFITIVPEIEMPGHSSAAIAAYPELSCFPNESTKHPPQCAWNGDSTGKQVQQTWGVFDDVFCAGKENTFKFLEDVMDEVLNLFPSTYIHVGGDECPKANWKRCPQCQQRIKENHLKDEHELQSYFIQRMEKYLNNKGRTLIGWDEILEGGLAPKAMVMSWRGEQGGIDAAKQDHDVIMTPGGWCYFDHSQTQNEDSVTIGGYTPIDKVYGYEPVPAALDAEKGKHVLGAQGNVWTEYMGNTKKVEYMVLPRISALSEVLWTSKEKRNWDDFQNRLMIQFKRFDLWKINYSHAYFDLNALVSRSADSSSIEWKLESKMKNTHIIYYNEISPLLIYSKPIPIRKTHRYSAILYSDKDEELSSITQNFEISKSTGKKIILTTPASRNYPGDGPFTLVNGIVSRKGFSRSREFLGFNGTDCEAIIDFGKTTFVNTIQVDALREEASWIYRPLSVEAFGSTDGINYKSIGLVDYFSDGYNGNGTMTTGSKTPSSIRYLKVVIKNWGMIPEGQPGAGNKPWLFVSEIYVDGPDEWSIRQ